jgi:iron complex outermembrane recepter protein
LNSNESIRRAILAVLGTTTAATAFGPRVMAADATAAADSGALEEIVVTATRRSENLQDVPITIQAFSNETLSQLNVETFDDLVKNLPNVTDAGNGPGQGNIFMRGLSAGNSGSQSTGSIAPYANVAIYLDDQSGQLPGRNLDVYAADLERVEILEGPQGTLFGAGAEAGVVRYITNKPKLDVIEGSVTGSYGTTAGGDPNSSFNAVLNLPVITDTLAVRAVIYNDSRGGYINNVPGTFTRHDTDLGIHYAHFPATGGACPDGGATNGACVPPGSPVINNYEQVQNAINPVTYDGIRASALWKLNDDWNFLLEQTFQNTDSHGVFYQMPYSSDGVALPPLSVTLFNPNFDQDKFANTAWTVNGKLGPLKLVYTGGYLVRNIDQVQDYTNYARGAYADYYQCYGSATTTPFCNSPSSTWREQERNTHLSNELRVSSPDDWRLRFIAGVFNENLKIYDRTTWDYKTLPDCTFAGDTGCEANVAPAPGATVVQPGIRGNDTAFFEDITRGYTQTAEFASVDFDIVPKVLTVTAGARHFDFNNHIVGTDVSSFSCLNVYAPNGCTNDAADIDARHASLSNSGTKSRANVVWHVTPDALLYYTWSQGFRPGAYNRAQGCHFPDTETPAIKQWCIPSQYASDTLVNNEIGWKSEFLDHRLQVNGAIYQENWNNVQIEFFDPTQTGNLAFYTNGQDFRVRGAELTIVARVTRGLTVNLAASWNQSVQTNSPDFIANNPALLATPAGTAEFGKPVAGLSNLFGPVGDPSPDSPDFQGNLHARYEWSSTNYNWFAMAGVTTTTSSFSQGSANPSIAVNGAVNTTLLRFQQPGYSTADVSVGLAKDNWNVKLFCENLTDSHASTFTSTAQFVVANEVIRPRTDGITIGYKF